MRWGRFQPPKGSITSRIDVRVMADEFERDALGTRAEQGDCLVTRLVDGHPQLLLFRHPIAGIQIPAGTVEPGVAADDAVIGAAIEETDLFRFTPPTLLWR